MATIESNKSQNSTRWKAIVAMTLFFLVIGAVITSWWLLVGQFREKTDDAYVGGYDVQITPRVSGTVVSVLVDDTQQVEAGHMLVEMDKADAAVSLEQAEATLADAVRSVRGLYSGSSQTRAAVSQKISNIERLHQQARQAEAEWQRARDDLIRKEGLAQQKFISTEALQSVRATAQSAEAAWRAAEAAVKEGGGELDQAREQKIGADVLVDGTTLNRHPRVVMAAAQVKAAYLALHRATISAPVSGFIAKRTVQIGQHVDAGKPLMSVIPLNQLWVDANFKEAELSHVRLGQPVTMTADLYGTGFTFHGKVIGLSPGTGAAFAVLPPQNASGNWIKIVQRLPVRIQLDQSELEEHPLRMGLSMRVNVDTQDRSGSMLAKVREAGLPIKQTSDQELNDAELLITRIISQNRGATRQE